MEKLFFKIMRKMERATRQQLIFFNDTHEEEESSIYTSLDIKLKGHYQNRKFQKGFFETEKNNFFLSEFSLENCISKFPKIENR